MSLRSCTGCAFALFATAILFCITNLHGHIAAEGETEHEHAAESQNQVSITKRDGYMYIAANGIPSHKVGQFPNRRNPHTMTAQNYRYRLPMEPVMKDKIQKDPRRVTFGIALNGVPFDPSTAEFYRGQSQWNYEALTGKLNLGEDMNHAHVQPSGAYHYHGLPTGLIKNLREKKNLPPDTMLLVGYAADGFPIYAQFGYIIPSDPQSGTKKLKSSYVLRKGERPDGDSTPNGTYDGTFTADFVFVEGAGDLDQCNGRFGVTPEYPQGTYYYLLTDQFPFVPRIHRGIIDPSFIKKRMPRMRGNSDRRGSSNRAPNRSNRLPGR